MLIDMFEEGYGRVEITQEVPSDLRDYLLKPTSAHALLSQKGRSLLQQFSGNGFEAWYSRVWASAPFQYRTRGNISALELRVAWQERIKGKWENIDEPSIAPHYFQFAYTPYIDTIAVFDAAAEYQTFDVHFSFAYLMDYGLDYALMDKFLRKVDLKQAAALAPRPYKCSREMIHLIQLLLVSNYSAAGHKRQLHNHIASILTAALETVSIVDGIPLVLKPSDKAALHHARDIIESIPFDEYPGNDVLARKVLLNTHTFGAGFKQLFGSPPEQYFRSRRFSAAVKFLAQGFPLGQVAHMLGYANASNFVAEFRKHFGVTPHQWRLLG